MLIKKLSAIAALSGFAMFSTPVFADDADVKELLLKQQRQIEALQQKVEKQQTVHNEALTHYIKNEIDRALEAKGTSLLSLGSNVENLTIKGDLRVRYEAISYDNNNSEGDSEDHFRQRFRLGFVWKTNEGWEIGAGLTTGHESGGASGGKGATSANDTYSRGSAFNNGDIFLDYAYAKHKWSNGFSLTLGQHKNPFVGTSILWDSDVRFVGATAQYNDESGIFLTGGAYVVETFDSASAGGENDDAEMLALQVGIENSGFTVAGSYYHFDSANTVDTLGLDKAYDLQMLSAYVEYAGKTDSFNYKVFGEYTVNIGADNADTQVEGNSEEEDTAWILGGEIGIDKWKFKYLYGHIGSDSMHSQLSDSDFGGSTATSGSNNVEGHKFGIGYKVTKNFEIAATYILTERVEDSGNNRDSGELFQLDFQYKF